MIDKLIVQCLRDGKEIAKYEFGIPRILVPSAGVDEEGIRAQVKTQLTNDRIAFPPWKGIDYKFIYIR